MVNVKGLAVILLLLTATESYSNKEDDDDNEVDPALELKKKIHEYNAEIALLKNQEIEAKWTFASNITDYNENVKNEIYRKNAQYYKKIAEDLSQYDYKILKDSNLERQFKKLSEQHYDILSDTDYKLLLQTIDQMQSNYAKVKVCSYKNERNCSSDLEGELALIFAKSRNPKELKHYWIEWYNKSGKPVRQNFKKYVELSNKAAILNNFTSAAEAWLSKYETDDIERQMYKIYSEIRPFYLELHAYVRYRLEKKYGALVPKRGPIPMHLLGNMWSQSWVNILSLTLPYRERPLIDVTTQMKKKCYTPVKMFQMGDDFFQSMNMTPLPETFWEKSILEKPKDQREIVCHASAWDFVKTDDVRIKQCTQVTMSHFITAHHELGHIQYYLQYQHLPFVYRRGANPGFHEAVGDVLALSVSTLKHLKKIGLVKNYYLDEELRINQLFLMALNKVVFLPFALSLEQYRWDVFRGKIDSGHYNCAFWNYREQYSGIEPPVQRDETNFDPAAKYHIAADVEYLRYFIAHILQFQFLKAACIKAGDYKPGNSKKPFDDCDIYQSTNAGNAFKAMLAMGSSKPWPDALESFTGERDISAKAIMEYFAPLYIWLKKENRKNQVPIGWSITDRCITVEWTFVRLLITLILLMFAAHVLNTFL